DPFHNARRGERAGAVRDAANDDSDVTAADEAADEADQARRAEPESAASGPADYYARLNTSPTVTPDDLRRAYHRLVKLWHPDRYAGAPEHLRERAERRMRQLNEAYGVLSDPVSRAAYDHQREGPGAPIGDVINVFGQRASASAFHSEDAPEGHASANPNGAGQFFGMLAAILALALIGGAVSGASFGGAVGALIVLLGIVGLVIAASFFVTDSPLARWAFHTLEADPKGAARGAERSQPADQTPPPPSHDDLAGARDASGAHVSAETFDALIEEALAAVPHTFDAYMRNIIVRAEQEPDAETLERAGVPEGHTLLGLYHGISLTRRGASDAGPEVITIYRGPIERYCRGDLAAIRRQVRATVLHEVAHHFGIDHDDMPEWVK
ncbi:MAG TPA: metallopeptidase family protein, partial [Ktedonobacterales bacterium]|nr:metallopeptidase family protein [Ktedonobacterales bacterium]